MKRAMHVYPLLIFAITISARGADPAPSSQPGAEDEVSAEAGPNVAEPVIPRRELTFEQSDEVISRRRSTVPDPKLFEYRYMAFFRSTAFAPGARRRGPNNIADRNLSYMYDVAFESDFRPRRDTQLFPTLVRNTPKDRLPPAGVLSVLTTQGASLLVLARGSYPNPDDPRRSLEYYRFGVLAPTPERAEQLVEGVLALYDYGLSYPIQHEYLKLRQAAEKKLPELREAKSKKEDEFARAEKQLEALKDSEDIDKESLVKFRAQLRLIAVDLAGIEARIEACNKILANLKKVGPDQRIEKIETVKITMEIELVGLAAKNGAIEKLVEMGERRVGLIDQVAELQKQLSIVSNKLSGTERVIADYEAARIRYEPFPIQDNKVVIHPITWQGGRDGWPEWPE